MEEHKNRVPGLAETKKALEAWRRDGGGYGQRIPAAIWSDAAVLARLEGVGRVARILGLDRLKLRGLAEASSRASTALKPEDGPEVTLKPEPSVKSPFVEVGRLEVGARPMVSVQLVGREGDRVQMEFPVGAAGAVDLVGLVQAFWSRPQ